MEAELTEGGEEADSVRAKVVDSIRVIITVAERHRNAVGQSFGLVDSDLRALSRLSVDGACSQRELASKLGLTPGAVTGLVDRLVERRLVARVADEKDRRRRGVVLTPDGLGVISVGRAAFSALLGRLEHDQLVTMADHLQELALALSAGSP